MTQRKTIKALRANWWIVLILTALTLMCLLPILHTVAISFSDQAKAAAGEVMFWPNGFSLNKDKYTDIGGQVGEADIIDGKYILAQKGKKDYYIIKVK